MQNNGFNVERSVATTARVTLYSLFPIASKKYNKPCKVSFHTKMVNIKRTSFVIDHN